MYCKHDASWNTGVQKFVPSGLPSVAAMMRFVLACLETYALQYIVTKRKTHSVITKTKHTYTYIYMLLVGVLC